jgi:hypothetical protein
MQKNIVVTITWISLLTAHTARPELPDSLTQQATGLAINNNLNIHASSPTHVETITTMSASPNVRIESDGLANSIQSRAGVKEWTFITYMAADNDLAPFARKNLKQEMEIGSTPFINVVTQLDTRIGRNTKITKRYYIEKNKLLALNNDDPHSQRMDSGSPATLIDCCRWAIQNFPAKHYALVLWNHGTGIIDIGRPRRTNPLHLFTYNQENNLIELDRSIPFLDYVEGALFDDQRGICFDDSTGHYLSNQGLEEALREITHNILKGNKLDIVCFDACLMSMLEIANISKDYAKIMVSSQEVELGTGYDYKKILAPFLSQSLDAPTFAHHIVKSYEQTYQAITNDFTQAAINLNDISLLEQNVNNVAELLLQSLNNQKNNSLRDAIKTSKHKLLCTHFDEPSYIDLYHFYANLITNLKHFNFNNEPLGKKTKQELLKELQSGLLMIPKTVIANAAGKNLKVAQGISIYFPERKIHNSYRYTKFASQNSWYALLGNLVPL